MRYGIIADVHGNLRAFETVLGYLRSSGVEKLLFLGDLVGYGPEPSECVDLLRAQADVTPISGNHDRQVVGEKDPKMRRTASRALDWTREKLSTEQIEYLRSLPQGHVADDTLMMVHGSLVTREAYILSMKEVEENRKMMVEEFAPLRICFFAHTHVPMLVGMTDVITGLRESRAFKLDPKEIYLINPGAVGQPRDGCPLTAFGIFDTDSWTMTFVRRPYDIEGTSRSIVAAGLPAKFARRLEAGK